MSSESEGGGEVRATHPEMSVPFAVYLVLIVVFLVAAIVVGISHH